MKRYMAIGAAIVLTGLTGCDDRLAVVNDFYRKNTSLDAQKAAIKAYNSEEKWHIFAYGAARGEENANLLALTVANDGKSVIDAVEDDFRNGNPDLHYLSANLLFVAIQEGKHYDICGDAPLRSRMEGYAEEINDPHIKDSYLHSLEELCVPAEGSEASAHTVSGGPAL